jgi:hypothetical protein
MSMSTLTRARVAAVDGSICCHPPAKPIFDTASTSRTCVSASGGRGASMLVAPAPRAPATLTPATIASTSPSLRSIGGRE